MMEKAQDTLTVTEVLGKDKPNAKRQISFSNEKGQTFVWHTSSSKRFPVGHTYNVTFHINWDNRNERVGFWPIQNLRLIARVYD